MTTDQRNKHALTIQKRYRGYISRKKYQIEQRAPSTLYCYRAFMVGNDPIIHNLEKHRPQENDFVLIGNSGMRVLLIAARLSAEDRTKIPKIILIDYSLLVHKLWEGMRDLVEKAETKDAFLEQLPDFWRLYKHLLMGEYENESLSSAEYHTENPVTFMKKLVDEYGYSYIRKLIQQTSLIRQTWQHTETFFKLKNILTHLEYKNIYVYASNIPSCFPELGQKIIENIQMLQPRLSIHTQFNAEFSRPDKVKLYTTEDADFITQDTFPEGAQRFLLLVQSKKPILPANTVDAVYALKNSR